MQRLVRRVGLLLGSLLALCIVGAAIVYGLSERVLRHQYDVPTVQLTVPTDADSIREGRRLATILGCENGCHGSSIQGSLMFDQPRIARIVAPNLTDAVQRYDVAQLDAAIRHGVRHDGRSLLIMPAEALVDLTDEELRKIIAYLRSVPKEEGPEPSVSVGPIGRIGLVLGKLQTAVQRVSANVRPPEGANDQEKKGRHLAITICGECHGTALTGDSNPHFTSPGLQMVATYSPMDFTRLLRTGIAMGDRQLGVMSERARNNLTQLTDNDIAALYSYLQTFGSRAAAAVSQSPR